jgi:hypothetical protein
VFLIYEGRSTLQRYAIREKEDLSNLVSALYPADEFEIYYRCPPEEEGKTKKREMSGIFS